MALDNDAVLKFLKVVLIVAQTIIISIYRPMAEALAGKVDNYFMKLLNL